MEKNVCIVHFNTPMLTRATIRSIWKNTPDCKITVFDNSDKYPFGRMEGVNVIDNTFGQIINFERFLRNYPNKMHTYNNWGSAKHTYTIDYLFNLFHDGFVLADSDILVKQDISDFFDESAIFSGKIYSNPAMRTRFVPRLLPFLCWINVPMCREAGVRYFDGKRSWKLYPTIYKMWYDTGASFLEDALATGKPYKEIDIDNYMIHLGSGSCGKKDHKAWLEENKELYG